MLLANQHLFTRRESNFGGNNVSLKSIAGKRKFLSTFRWCFLKKAFKYFFCDEIQYVVLGLRLKVINLNILPESSRNELKYSLKIAFLFLSIILKFQVPDINILLGIRKNATLFNGPWSANVVLVVIVIVSTQKCDFHNISCIFFLLLMQLS